MAKILLATSDTGLYDILAAEITGEGYALLWAVDGQDAYEQCLAEQPDLMLLDVNTTVFNGFEVCEMLRGDPDVPERLPVLLLTDDEVNPRTLEKLAASACFPKNHLAQELTDALVKHLGANAGP